MTTQHHLFDGDGDPITVRVGPMGSAVAFAGHLAPDETGPLAVPPSEKVRPVCDSDWDFDWDANPNASEENAACGASATHEVRWGGDGKVSAENSEGWQPVCQKHADRSVEEYGVEVRPLSPDLPEE